MSDETREIGYHDKQGEIVEALIEVSKWRENVSVLEDHVLVDELETYLPYSDQLDQDIVPIILKFHSGETGMLIPEDRVFLENTYILVSSKYSIEATSGEIVTVMTNEGWLC